MKQTDIFTLGLSPCPNDTFIFHALLHGLISVADSCPLRIEPYMADVEMLNKKALDGDLEFTKISVGALPYIMDKYMVLSSGAALGWGCGPLLVGRTGISVQELGDGTIAIPGKMTTASMLLDLHGGFAGPRKEMLFSDIIPAVAAGDVAAGLVIHEGRFTYDKAGLYNILDLGEWWEKKFHLPLPLGAIVARRDLPLNIIKTMEKAIAASLAHAWAHPQDSAQYIKENAQELDPAVTSAHIKTFVTDYSMDLGDAGRQAMRKLVGAISHGPSSQCTDLLFVN